MKNNELGEASPAQSLIKIKVGYDLDNYILQSGKVVEGILTDKDFYTFDSTADKVQIICNSMLQSTLLLVNVGR